MTIEIVPTIVPESLADVGAVSERYAGFASFFQIDVADGKFAPNTTWLPSKGDALPERYGYEIHLMVSSPDAIGDAFADAGARSLIGHLEAFSNPDTARRTFRGWRKAGVRSVGIALLLQTPLEEAEAYLPDVDFVLLMTIARIGVQGIPYEPSAAARVVEFHERYPDTLIAVDGGVSEKTISELAAAGARRFGVGSAIVGAKDPAAVYVRLKALAEAALA